MGLLQDFFLLSQKLFAASSLLQVSLVCLTVNIPSVLPSASLDNEPLGKRWCFCYPNLTFGGVEADI